LPLHAHPTSITSPLSLHDALPISNAISARTAPQLCVSGATQPSNRFALVHGCITYNDGSAIWAVDPNHPTNKISLGPSNGVMSTDRKSTRLNSSHGSISYAVFCLK